MEVIGQGTFDTWAAGESKSFLERNRPKKEGEDEAVAQQ
jgi:hypothetical protein